MKNVKIKVKTDEQNLAVQKKLMELNHKNESVAWNVSLTYGYDTELSARCGKALDIWLLIRI